MGNEKRRRTQGEGSKHAAQSSPSSNVPTPKNKGASSAVPPPSSIASPKALSSKVLTMKFMQRSAKNKTAEETVPGASHQAASPFDTEEIHGPPRIVVVEGGRHPLLRLGAGRRSFGGINPAIETWAILRDKDYRRAIRDANRVTSATHVKREVDVNAILAAKEDGKDLSDKQMAAVLGHKRSHVQEGVEAEEGGDLDQSSRGTKRLKGGR